MDRTIFVCLLLLISCSPNQKYFKFDFNEENASKIHKVVITPIDMIWEKPKGTDYKSIRKLETVIESYVKNSGLSIQSNHTLVEKWNKEAKSAGGFFNPVTGKIDGQKIGICLMKAVASAREEQDFDAVIFVKLIERPALLAGDRVYWDGCSRKLKDDNGYVITDITWQGEMNGLSLQIQIFDRNHHLSFQNIGAIEFPYEFSESYSKKEFVWKDSLEFITEEINEGIGIAFHPFIRYKKYPDKPKYYE